ncbi:OsmC family protein [Undibacterium sp.]|uniref:OsmC family protein n=1 Tax=Undibacterium sp. TaxID=1914977 RepID=UPI0027298435|nr:OsmC family protein [Undibacterium sp.]
MRWYARQQQWPLDKVEVTLTHHKEGVQDIFRKQVILHGAGLSEEQRTRLVAVAAKCPVQKTLMGSPIIETSAG